MFGLAKTKTATPETALSTTADPIPAPPRHEVLDASAKWKSAAGVSPVLE
ncbi:hypothetical protein AB0C21_33275 [Spirillospora sp. NPDC049024]